MGIGWNKAHSFLDYSSDCCVLPYDGDGTRDIYLDDFDSESDGYKILESFCEVNGFDGWFTISS
jgi:hypothetical protein